MMKKIVFLFAMMLMSVSGFAQQAKEIIDSYRGNDKVQIVDIDKSMMEQYASEKSETEREALKNAESITMLIVVDKKLSKEISKKFAKLTKEGYSTGPVDDDDPKFKDIQVYVKEENDTVTELVSIANTEGLSFVMLITGKFTEEEIQSMQDKE